jgi:hypothetical protein
MKKTVLSLLVFMLIFGDICLAGEIGSEEYTVYSAVLAQIYPSGPKTFVITSATSDNELLTGELIKYIEENSMFTQSGMFNLKLDEDMVEDYNEKNAEKHMLSADGFDLPQEVILISSEELDEIFWGEGGGWNRFYSRFPVATGTINLSRVGFDNDKTGAIIYIGIQSDFLIGRGDFLLLAKDNGKWRIVDKVMIWIS